MAGQQGTKHMPDQTHQMPQIHRLADVLSNTIGSGTRIWQFAVVLPGAVIGSDCNICANSFIENDVVLGNRVTVKNGVALYDGLRVEDDVFIGPYATFTNDVFPRSKRRLPSYPNTVIQRGASIGANATILPGITIGEGALIGAGSVVTQDVPAFSLVAGNPARLRGVADEEAEPELPLPEQSVREVKDLPVPGVRLFRLDTDRERRGSVAHAGFGSDIPFTPRGLSLYYDLSQGAYRGDGAHKTSALYMICLGGRCRILLDDSERRHEVELSRPNMALYIPPGVWYVLHSFSEKAALLVFASAEFDADDYLVSYETFRAFKQAQRRT